MRRGSIGIFLLPVFLFVSSASAQTFDVLHVFDNSNEAPVAPLLAAPDGNLYLPTWGGGTGYGAIYRLTPDGSGGFSCATIHAFSGTDGANPAGGLVEGPDGLLYGTTNIGGSSDWGVLYRISMSGDFELIRSFSLDDAAAPSGELVLAGDGKLYGTSPVGGASGGGNGTVFRYDPNGNAFEIVYFFGSVTGANPESGLLLGTDGKLYGSTPNGGAEGYGTLFRLDTNGSFELLCSLPAADAISVSGPLVEGTGSLYGTAHGMYDNGSLFRWDSVNGYVKIHDFSGTDGSRPVGGLTASGGLLYGVTQNGGPDFDGNVFVSDTDGNVTSLHVFDYLDGAQPSARPIRVGISWVGTTMTAGPGFSGTVYALPDGGPLSTVCAFGQGEGYNAFGTLVEASDGNLYGTTENGGLYYDQGTIFRLGKDGQVATVHSFNLLDGRYPQGDLVQGSDGALFGITNYGGANNGGAAFRMDLSGTFSLLRSYVPDDEIGDYPSALAIGPDGQLYGPTADGGNCGGGSLYRMGVDGSTANLHDLCDGARGPLLSASDGFLYGTGGGAAVFRLSTAGDFEAIASYSSFPFFFGPSALAEGPDQNLYAIAGDAVSTALVRILKDGRTSVLHTFLAGSGVATAATLVTRGADGRLYGASATGTADDPGTVYRISVYGDFEPLHVFDPADPQVLSRLLQGSDGKLYGLAMRNVLYGRSLAYTIDLGTQVNQIAPSFGPSFDTAPIQISGAAFQDGATISVGGTPATDVLVASSTSASATVPLLFPGTLNDVVLTNPDTTSGTLKNAWLADFLDVPQDDPFHGSVEKVFRSHVAGGYGNGLFGRNDPVTRAQMAVFLVKGGLGPGTLPAACSGQFVDVPCPSLFADWIEKLGDQHITAGCQEFPPAYCPDGNVTRAQMAVFILKTLHGYLYTPPACQGIFGDVPCPGAFAADWIEDLYNSGITAGCSTSPLLYCPNSPVSRGQMAIFNVRAFGLP